MARMKLKLDEIEVSTFELTGESAEARGTVEGMQSGLGFTCDPGGCMNSYGCHTAYCNQSAEIYCPTATCHEGCTAGCTGGHTWDQTCPPTCDWGGGCESGSPYCPA